VISLQGMSAHADAGQIVEWLRGAPRAPRKIFLTHGEPGPADALRERIERQLGWSASVARMGQKVDTAA
jgi:metallo-beta-lactamase family protein